MKRNAATLTTRLLSTSAKAGSLSVQSSTRRIRTIRCTTNGTLNLWSLCLGTFGARQRVHKFKVPFVVHRIVLIRRVEDCTLRLPAFAEVDSNRVVSVAAFLFIFAEFHE